MKKIEYLQYNWDEEESALLVEAIAKINNLIDAVDELQNLVQKSSKGE